MAATPSKPDSTLVEELAHSGRVYRFWALATVLTLMLNRACLRFVVWIENRRRIVGLLALALVVLPTRECCAARPARWEKQTLWAYAITELIGDTGLGARRACHGHAMTRI